MLVKYTKYESFISFQEYIYDKKQCVASIYLKNETDHFKMWFQDNENINIDVP